MSTFSVKLGLTSLLIGLGLLGLNGYGLLSEPLNFVGTESNPVPGYHTRTVSINDALNEFDELKLSQLSREAKARKLFSLIDESFIHAPSYRLKPWDNWLVWLRGLIDESFLASSQDINLLWRRGGGFCRQAAWIYAGKAQELGLKSRVILLTGHVVTEVYLENAGWRVVDPDLGVFWEYPLKSFGSDISETAISQKLVSRGFQVKYANEIAKTYVTQADNITTPFPLSSNRLRFEQRSAYVKWILPIMLTLAGFWLLFSRNIR